MKGMNLLFLVCVLVGNFALAQDFTLYNQFLKQHVQYQEVDYAAIQSRSTDLNRALAVFRQTNPNSSWSKNETLAFWLNAYNAYALKLIVDNYPITSLKTINYGKPLDVKLAEIGGRFYSLNQIENQVLSELGDPRVYFLISNGTKSSPGLFGAAFNAENVQQKLDELTHAFINDASKNSLEINRLQLSAIFEVHAKEFKPEKGVLGLITRYSSMKNLKKPIITFLPYNWDLR